MTGPLGDSLPAMTRRELEHALEAALRGRKLLSHPFYERWQAGELEEGELAAYAEQYRYVEAALPATLEAIASGLESPTARSLVRDNLADERGEPTHLQLFEGFADAVGARPQVAKSVATDEVLGAYSTAVGASALAGLGTVAAYECQAAAIASSKAEGLRELYLLDDEATEFWDLHATLELEHGAWAFDALEAEIELAGDPDALERVAGAMSLGATAWWSWLDEREGERPSLHRVVA